MTMYRITFKVSFAGHQMFNLVVHPEARVSAVFDKALEISRGRPCHISWSETVEVSVTRPLSDLYVGP